jgi:xylulokinase
MSALTCGVDIGSTNVKVTFVDEHGRAVWTRTVPTPRLPDESGVATDALGLVALIEEMIIAGWRTHGGSLPLQAIAAAGVGEDGVGVRADLVPTGLALPWFDERAATQANDLQRTSRYAAQAGLAIDYSRTAAKWLWLRQNRPADLLSSAFWVALTDYPAVAWTGRAFMSETLAARTACYDVYARCWIEPLLTAASAPTLPPVVPAGTVLGSVRKGPLRESGAASTATVVVAGGHDHPIAAATIRRLHPDALVDSMGTANLVYGETRDVAEPRLDPYVAFSVPPMGNAGVSCLGVFELAAAIQSLRGTTNLVPRLLALKRITGVPRDRPIPIPGSYELLARSGDEPTEVDVRAALEAATFYAWRMFDEILAAGAKPAPIFATGGWARSHALIELRASIFGQPVIVVDEPELTAIGAALIAAQGATGVALPFGEGLNLQKIEPVADWIEPYAGLYQDYRARLDAATAQRSVTSNCEELRQGRAHQEPALTQHNPSYEGASIS